MLRGERVRVKAGQTALGPTSPKSESSGRRLAGLAPTRVNDSVLGTQDQVKLKERCMYFLGNAVSPILL
jgi:hypothetical protein